MKIEIYVAGHKDSARLPGKTFIPIHAGRRGKEATFCEIGDDTGDNISSKNDTFCELTALYWMWKNTSGQDYIGLFHYRRHLNFSPVETKVNKWGVTEYQLLDESYIETNQLTDLGAATFLKGLDLVLPIEWDVSNAGSESVIEHYRREKGHHIGDYERAIHIMKNKYPAYAPFARKAHASKTGFFNNMFVARRQVFDDYCEWLFDILFELEKELDLTTYTVQERRVFGYISERLLNIYLEKLLFDRPDLKVKTTQRTFIVDTSPVPRPSPAYSEGAVPVVIAFNDTFAPYGGTAIYSMLLNADNKKKYDILVLGDKLSERNKTLLSKSAAEFPNASIRFLNPNSFFNSVTLPVHLHFSKETYYRLYIPELFSEYDRVIYLDADTLVKDDISKLFDIDIKGKAIGAVRDCVMVGFRKFKTKSLVGLETPDYLESYLKLRDLNSYFSAGVLIFDIKKSSKAMPVIKSMLERGKPYWYVDQDILNFVFQDDVHYIDERWNVFNGNGNTSTFFEHLPASTHEVYFNSRKDPYIIHYAGERKPWKFIDVDFAEDFWAVARRTPWYEKILSELLKDGTTAKERGRQPPKKKAEIAKSQPAGFREGGLALVNASAPLGTRRRAFLRRCRDFVRRLIGH